MLISENTIVKWNSRYKKYYEEKGYIYTKMGNEFEVKVEDLTSGSNVFVDVECDGCEEPLLNIVYNNYKKYIKEDGRYYCSKCAHNGFKKWISFYEWCYINLSKEEADDLLSRWDYDLNIKNDKVLNPKDVGYSSHGLDRKGYWFKCLKHSEHKSEQKNINSLTKGSENNNINCNQCNSISITHPHLEKYLVNKEDAYKYSYGSNKKVSVKCPECGYKKEIEIFQLIDSLFNCQKCSDGISYSEKFMFNILEQLQLGEYFRAQLSKTILKWCGNYRYDFYIDKFNMIIETHGRQHYEENANWEKSLSEIQENDKNKERFARVNGIHNYIILDCRKSEIEWIKNSIMESQLPQLLNFKEEDIDWLACHEASCKSLVKTVCDLWNTGINSTIKIADIMKIHRSTATRYLKQGAKLKWCDYDVKEVLRQKEHFFKPVTCLTTNKIFDSIVKASKEYNIRASTISACCRNKRNSAGKLPDGTKLVWIYYDEYIKNQIQLPYEKLSEKDSSFCLEK